MADPTQADGLLERHFRLRESGTTVRREVLGGITTFMTMAYIVVVNPQILGAAGMDFRGVMAATCLAAALGTLLMGLLARYPIALAPGMGLNAFLAYTVCLNQGVPWQEGLGLVFVAGVIFLLLTVLKVREMIIEAIPRSIKLGAAVGIGLFIAFIGMQNAGIVVNDDVTLVTFGDLGSGATLAAAVGVIVTAGLLARRIGASVLIGILVTAGICLALGAARWPEGVVAAPRVGSVALQLDIAGALQWKYVGLIFVFLFFDLFDTLGTLIGVGEQAGFMKEGKLPRIHRALFADAAASVGAALLGTSTVTSYIESGTGVAAGARTGLANVVTAGCFLLALFFGPLAEMLGETKAITAPALIVVGSLMTMAVRKIPWDDFTEAFPAFVTIVAMPFTYRIAEGLALGFITYPLVKVLAGKARDVHPLVWALAGLLSLRYVFLAGG